MKRAILEIYALAVCFFTVACFAITLGLALWNVVELAAPEFTVTNHQFSCHQTDHKFKECFPHQAKYTVEDGQEVFLADEALTLKRTTEYAQIIQSEQRDALQGLVQKLIILLIDIIVFFSHWVIATRARKTA